jgi:hypothetical protein
MCKNGALGRDKKKANWVVRLLCYRGKYVLNYCWAAGWSVAF